MVRFAAGNRDESVFPCAGETGERREKVTELVSILTGKKK